MKKRILALVLSVALALSLGLGAAAAYTVQPGDNLSSIAKDLLGDATKWKDIFDANKDTVRDPNLIYVGQELNIPGDEPVPEPDDEDEIVTSDSFIEPAYAETEYGWLFGYKEDSTYIFKGVQYGVVAERFMPAVEPEAWPGIKAALTYGETANNTSNTVSISSFVDNMNSDMVQNEQCLYLNVWTQSLSTEAKKPVIFFIHGGGFTSGASNELAFYEGKNISEFGDVVYVNVNHRLNYLGYTDLSAYGDEYAMSGDVGMQDLVMALEWVRDNIANFGGDPENVTIMGQSGGGSKVTLLLEIPEAADLFERAVLCSGGGINVGTDVETAQAAGKSLVEQCKTIYGIETDEEAIAKLQSITYEDLVQVANAAGMRAPSPTVGNDYIPETYNSETNAWPEIAKDKAIIVSNTFGELAGNDGILCMPMLINMQGARFDPENPDAFLEDYYKPNMTEEDQIALVKAKYGDYADAIMAEFKRGFPSRDIIDVVSANRNRQASTNTCLAKAAQGGAPVYNCIFTYEYPLMGGIMNYHTGGDLGLWLYNLDCREFIIKGDEETAYRVAKEAATALVNFAYTGDPGSELVDWPEFTKDGGETMLFDDVSEIVSYPDQKLLELITEAIGPNRGWG